MPKHLIKLLPECRTQDRFKLKKSIERLAQAQTENNEKALAQLQEQVERSRAWVSNRRAALAEPISFPESLPVVVEKKRIQTTIANNQVVVIAGETGSGKTTQLPKMLLDMGYGAAGLIGHTQPRRLAARSVANRIQDELGAIGKSAVNYKVRFQDNTSDQTSVKLMTDGILLAELQSDPYLSQYEVIIIDEAHERSLNIDFLLGVLHKLLKKRADLKLIITSATIETERFSQHFGNAPVLEVSGRTFPVEMRYQPLLEDGEQDLHQGVIEAAEALMREGPGDILVFLSGEREIRDLAESLTDAFRHERAPIDIIPLYARLSAQEQNRVFQTGGNRRIVLATNVAETSLTVPGIRYVIDPGLARMSRYSYRTKVQRLPVEPISQASANQRAGRCGRTGPGICVRLYSEEDYLSRPLYTDPEILRTNLASVILQMASLKLGDIRKFPFLQRPDDRFINDGIKLLEELCAIETSHGKRKRGKDGQLPLTSLGRQLGRLPVDPRLGRMILAAADYHCVREVLVITAALSIQDPRERPHDKQQKADELHKRFEHEGSDFLSFLRLWEYVQGAQKEDSGNQFRKRCQREFIHYLRVREWQDVYTQLRYAVRELGLPLSDEPSPADNIHQALLTGLLSHVGSRDEKYEYTGARQSRFFIFPGSGLFQSKPKWVMAAELVETAKLYARCVAKIEPEWIEKAASHLIKRSYNEPRYSKKQGAVVASEQATLFGLLLFAGRQVHYGKIAPELAREIFIREAIVEQQMKRPPEFVLKNQQLIESLQALEEKSRRRDILIDQEALFVAYDNVVPAHVRDDRSLQQWWQKATADEKARLLFQRSDLMLQSATHVTEASYPDDWVQGPLRLPLEYKFEPGEVDDGANIVLPVAALTQVVDEGFDWQIPAFRHELVTAWIKSLPKKWRRNFVPAPDYANAVLAALTPFKEPLLEGMSRELKRMSGIEIPRDAWQNEQVAEHLKINFKVLDEKGKVLAQGRDLTLLQQQLKGTVKAKVSETAGEQIEQEGLTDWSFGALPAAVETAQGRFAIKAFPALNDEGNAVAIRVFDHEADATRAQQRGLRKLVYLQVPSPVKYLQTQLSAKSKLAMYFNPWGKVEALIQDCIFAAIDQLMARHTEHVITEAQFRALVDYVRAELNDVTLEIVQQVERCLLLSHSVNKALKGKTPLSMIQSYGDIKQHLASLIFPGFVTEFGAARLPDIERYLKALVYRLERLPVDPNRDRLRVLQVEKITEAWQQQLNKIPQYQPVPEPLSDFRWWLEEFRVSLFAQALGTAFPVSEQRLKKQLQVLEMEKGASK
ncbi:ATP-dependent RNA helicase HrpA [Aliidiomarina celeris]|uniref:ATP-dependent RNA helicase HrpA n=1 Tax=Aliidiomarina celeris TaxID=2249428 RepID=UPI000DE8615C|nr:ATP-dependent RNA helicase HrpA [Aliidiomarina celeris]